MFKNYSAARRQARLFAACADISYAAAVRRLNDAHIAAAGHRHDATEGVGLVELPYSGGRSVNTDLAARLVAAVQDGCRHCRIVLSVQSLDHRPTVAALAGTVFWPLPKAGRARDSTVRWHALARRAHADPTDSAAAAAVWEIVEDMDAPQVYGLLDDALRLWAVIKPPLLVIHHAELGDDPGGEPHYQVTVASISNDGHQVPSLVLGHEAGRAGLAHLRQLGLPDWNKDSSPVTDPAWRLRASISTRALEEIVHVNDEEECDDIVLWKAAKPVRLPDGWWNLIDRVQHVAVCGPAAPGAPEQPAQVAVIARVIFR
ncbi:hypothetical protein ACFVH6_09580 [Spirillospora sp. NPDC127200]